MRAFAVALAHLLLPAAPWSVAAAGTAPLSAQSPPDADPPKKGLPPFDASTAGLDDLAGILDPIREASGVPALGAAILDSRALRALGVVGVRVQGGDAPATPADRWHLGSCTKAMTATLVARLVRNTRSETGTGRIRLSDAVTLGFATDKRRRFDKAWRDSSIRLLLQNRGGAPEVVPQELWTDLWSEGWSPQAQRERIARDILRRPPGSPPGTEYAYSNAGYALAGHLLELRTGTVFEELMRSELFEPLGIASAGFGAPGIGAAVDAEPHGHKQVGRDGPRGRYRNVKPGPKADNPAGIAPAGGVHMSLADWARFVSLHLRGARGLGTAGYLEAGALAELQQPALQNYACGWIVVERAWANGLALTHGGTNTMWYAVVWISPGRDRALLAVCNAGGDIAATACDEVVGALLPRIADGG